MQDFSDEFGSIAASDTAVCVERGIGLNADFCPQIAQFVCHYWKVRSEYVAFKSLKNPCVITVRRRESSGITKKLPVHIRPQAFAADLAAGLALDSNREGFSA
jgi:hypothetical protein